MTPADLSAYLTSVTTVPLSVGRLTVGEQVGQGANGVVRSGRIHGVEVAVKFLCTDDSGKQQRFRNEYFRVVSSGPHPGVVRMFHFDEVETPRGPLPVIVMERCHTCLAKSRGTVAGSEPELFVALLEALRSLHDAGIVHRDIKPENVLIRPDGGLVLGDLGIAKFDPAQHKSLMVETRKGERLGNFAFSAPEQALGTATVAADLYAVGQVVCWAINGAPLRGKMELIPKGRSSELRRIEAALEAVLRVDATERPQTVDEVRELLRASSEAERQRRIDSGVLRSLEDFSNVLRDVLPGRRGLTRLNESEGTQLLTTLGERARAVDLCWIDERDTWGDIRDIRQTLEGSWIIDAQELDIADIWVFRSITSERDFLMLRSIPQESLAPDSLPGVTYEEFGVVDGRIVSRAEYDDGRAWIDGNLVRLGEQCELRCRWFEERWIIFATKWSVVFLDSALSFRERLLANALAHGKVDPAWVEPAIQHLPRHPVSKFYS